MAYVGTAPANRVLSSADIAQGSVTLDDINFTDQPTNMDITGTIDKHTMRLADGVTITGDVTISDDLVLSKISDDGNAITMTNDGSSRTITGSGSIEASTLSQTPNQSLTGMTGTIGSAVTNNAGVASGVIGSAVTGGAGLSGMTSLGTVTTGTLGSGVTFPAGHIIQMKNSIKRDEATTSSEVDGGVTTGLTVTLDNNLASSSNKVIIMVNVGGVGAAANIGLRFWLNGVTTSAIADDGGGSCQRAAFTIKGRTSLDDWSIGGSMIFEDTPGTVIPQAYTLYFNGNGGAVYIGRPTTENGNGAYTISTITAMEVQV